MVRLPRKEVAEHLRYQSTILSRLGFAAVLSCKFGFFYELPFPNELLEHVVERQRLHLEEHKGLSKLVPVYNEPSLLPADKEKQPLPHVEELLLPIGVLVVHVVGLQLALFLELRELALNGLADIVLMKHIFYYRSQFTSRFYLSKDMARVVR